jgi:hypothetical protein
VSRLEVTIAVIAVANVLVMTELVRRRILREKYALLYGAVGFGGLVLALFRTAFDHLARELGVSYGPALLFLVAVMFLLFLCVSLSVEVSKLEERSEILAEEIALLRANQTYPVEPR